LAKCPAFIEPIYLLILRMILYIYADISKVGAIIKTF